MSKLKGLIWDVDGTLVDTSEWIVQAHIHALQVHGHPARTREEIASQVGKRLQDCYAFLAPGADYQVLLDAHRAFQADNLELIRPFQYVTDILEAVHKAGIRQALFTNRGNVLPSLEQTGINTKLFEVVVDATMVERGKPDPEGIYIILGELGLQDYEVAMIGDARVDIEAGKAAGLALTIGLTHGFGTRSELEAIQPDHVMDSLERFPDILLVA